MHRLRLANAVCKLSYSAVRIRLLHFIDTTMDITFIFHELFKELTTKYSIKLLVKLIWLLQNLLLHLSNITKLFKVETIYNKI